MLFIGRKQGESLVVGEALIVPAQASGWVRLAVEAPEHVHVLRGELVGDLETARRVRELQQDFGVAGGEAAERRARLDRAVNALHDVRAQLPPDLYAAVRDQLRRAAGRARAQSETRREAQ